MRYADISPQTEEDRRTEFREAAAGLYSPVVNIAAIQEAVRRARMTDDQRQGAFTAALARALMNSSTE